MSENFDTKQRTENLRDSGMHDAPFGVALGETRNVLENRAEAKLSDSRNEFDVRSAQEKLKKAGAGEGISNKISILLDVLQKVVDNRETSNSSAAEKSRSWVDSQRKRMDDLRKNKFQREVNRDKHKAVAALAQEYNPGTVTFQNPLERGMGAIKDIAGEVAAKLHEVVAHNLEGKAAKHENKAKQWGAWGEKLRDLANNMRTEARKITADNKKDATTELDSAKEARVDTQSNLAQSEAELQRLRTDRYMMPKADAASESMDTNKVASPEAAEITKTQADEMARRLSGQDNN